MRLGLPTTPHRARHRSHGRTPHPQDPRASPSGGGWAATTSHGRHGFTIDLDPRWVKKLISGGRGADADAYAEHLIDQAGFVLRTQDIGVLTITPSLLERLARRDDLAELVNVAYGDRGRVLVHHVSKSLLLPNNLERDVATRTEPLAGQIGDAVSDIAPVATFENEAVIEGVY